MFWGGGADEDERYARLGDRGEGQSDSGAGEILVKLLRQYRTILSADTASEARQLLSQKRR